MPYVPVSVNVYCAAFSGMMGALAAARQTTDNVAADYDHDTKVAGAFAAALDTALNDATPNVLQLGEIESIIGELFYTAFPTGVGSESKTATNYVALAGAVVARLTQGDAFVAGEGIVPPGVPNNPEISVAQTRFVSKGGNDATGDGSLGAPFLTVAAAIASITDATSAKPYQVYVFAGVYATAFTLKPWVFVSGAGIGVTYLAPTAAQILGAGFAGAGTQLAGLANATITTNLVTNFAAIVSTGTGKVDYQDLDLQGSFVLTGATATTNAYLVNVGWQGFAGFGKNMTIANMANVDMLGCSGGFGTLAISGTDAFFQELQASGCGTTFGSMTITWVGATVANALDCTFDSPPSVANTVTGLGAVWLCPGGELFYNLTGNADIQFDPFTGAGAAGAKIACEYGVTNLSVNSPGGDITIIFRRALNGSRVTVKNQTAKFISFSFTGAVSFQGSPSYLGPLGYCEMVFNGAVWFVENQVQNGTVVLVNGVSALIPADISATSVPLAELVTWAGATGIPVCKAADMVNGSRGGGGGFVVTSVDPATGLTVATDNGTYGWHVSPGKA